MSLNAELLETAEHNLTSATDLDDFEQKRYQNNVIDFNDGVLSKIGSFSQWLNSTGRIELQKCADSSQSETALYLLLNLKKSIKSAISEINKTLNNIPKTYTCPVCNEKVEVMPYEDYWETLQNHEHFEQNYIRAINGEAIKISNASSDEITSPSTTSEQPSHSRANLNNFKFNFDETISNLSTSSSSSSVQPTHSANNHLNDFKFNFNVKYDDVVQATIYPVNIVQAARKLDGIEDFTVQKSGPARGECLLCGCTLVTKGRNSSQSVKMSPFLVKNHVFGAKHMKNASSVDRKNALSRYHEFWLRQEPMIQAHQVYFTPEIFKDSCFTTCTLCQSAVYYNCVVEHILEEPHCIFVVDLYRMPEGKNLYHLLGLQMQAYGIMDAENKEKPSERVNNTQKSDVGRNKTKKEAPPTPEEKKPVYCNIVKSLVTTENDIQLPERYKEHAQFFEKRPPNAVWCKLCQLVFPGSINVAIGHIYMPNHRQLSNIKQRNLLYFCDICNISVRSEGDWHQHFNRGPNKHASIAPVRLALLTEYECKTCSTVIYGDELSLSRHRTLADQRRGNKKKEEVTLPTTAKRLFRNKQDLINLTANYLEEANEVLKGTDRMENCCRCIQQVLSGVYPNCQAYWFGSRVSGLGNYESDLDIFLDVGNMYNGEVNQSSLDQVEIVKSVSKELKRSKDFCQVFPIPAARTPIVKLHHGSTDLDCDLSFRHGLGVENTKFLRFCMEIQPITQSLILLLKHWSHRCGLNEHLTNYALALMAVYFLQIEGFLPSVKTIRNFNPTKAEIIDGWETINYTISAETMREFVKDFDSDLHQLLCKFYKFYSTFNYSTDVICPLLGHTIPKVLFATDDGVNLPPEMNSYKQRLVEKSSEQFRALSPFCIQDPFDLSHNLSKACPDGVVKKFKALCQLSLEHLESLQ